MASHTLPIRSPIPLTLTASAYQSFVTPAIYVPFPSAYGQTQITFAAAQPSSSIRPSVTIGGVQATVAPSSAPSGGSTGPTYGQGNSNNSSGWPVWATAVIAGVGGAIVFLLLFWLGCCIWRRKSGEKNAEKARYGRGDFRQVSSGMGVVGGGGRDRKSRSRDEKNGADWQQSRMANTNPARQNKQPISSFIGVRVPPVDPSQRRSTRSIPPTSRDRSSKRPTSLTAGGVGSGGHQYSDSPYSPPPVPAFFNSDVTPRNSADGLLHRGYESDGNLESPRQFKYGGNGSGNSSPRFPAPKGMGPSYGGVLSPPLPAFVNDNGGGRRTSRRYAGSVNEGGGGGGGYGYSSDVDGRGYHSEVASPRGRTQSGDRTRSDSRNRKSYKHASTRTSPGPVSPQSGGHGDGGGDDDGGYIDWKGKA